MEVRHPCRIRFIIAGLWPRYSRKEILKDKCIISEITSHTFADCDRMFFPDFLELAQYACDRFVDIYGRKEDNMVDLENL